MTLTIDEHLTPYGMEELIHEVRGTVAGIAAASRILHGGSRLHGADERRIEHLLEAELQRLEHLLGTDSDDGTHASRDAAPLSDLIDDVVLCHRIRGQRVRWQTGDDGLVDQPWEVREVLHILLDNAGQHAPGATTTVTVERHAEWVAVRVADDGPGVPEDIRARLFDRGVRAGASCGGGIGLHLARRLVIDLGGMLRLETDRAAGAAFVIVLPLHAARAAA